MIMIFILDGTASIIQRCDMEVDVSSMILGFSSYFVHGYWPFASNAII